MNLELREQVAKAMGHKRRSWPFLSDFAAAWEVVEFMRGRNRRLRLYERDGGDWFAEFIPTKMGQSYVMGSSAPTAPEAICRAALAALGASNETDVH